MAFPQVDAVYWLRGSYVRYSSVIWLPTSCASILNPAAWHTHTCTHRLWYQVSEGPRRVGSLLHISQHMTNKKTATAKKEHHTGEFKGHTGRKAAKYISSTIQCLQRKRCQNSNHYTMDHNCSVKYELREVRSTKACLKNKSWFFFFFGSFCLQRLAGAQTESMGISTFLPNKEQGFHVRNWAKAMDQLTSLNPLYHLFTGSLGNSPSHLSKQDWVNQYFWNASIRTGWGRHRR